MDQYYFVYSIRILSSGNSRFSHFTKLNKESIMILLDAPSILSVVNKNPLTKTFKFSNSNKL